MFRLPTPSWEKKKKRAYVSKSVKEAVFKRAKGRCENPKCHKPLKWGDKGRGKIKGIFHHTRDPSISPTEKTLRFLCPDCSSSLAHEYKTVTKRDLWLGERKERKITRKKIVEISKKKRSLSMVSHRCKLPVDSRFLYCGKTKAGKSCLRWYGRKCPNLIISRK